MKHQAIVLAMAVLLANVCASEPPKPAAPSDMPRVFLGKVTPVATAKSKPGVTAKDSALNFVGDDGATFQVIDDGGSKMLFLDSRLQNRPVRLTALQDAATKRLRVVYVQTVKDGKFYDVDYWCGICQISLSHPGSCYCCGDETELREQLAK